MQGMNALRTIAGVQRKIPHVLACCGCNKFFSTETARKEPEEIKIPVPWGHIAGKWWGRTDIQPVIALHGYEDNAGTFDPLVPHLNVDGLLAIDFPGHGHSSHFPVGKFYQFVDAVLTLRLITRHFKWNKVSLIGHSFGSATSLAYAATYPEEVDKYVSIECARTMLAVRPVVDVKAYQFADWIISVEDKMEKNKPPSYTYEEILKRLYEGSEKSPTIDSCKILLRRGAVRVPHGDEDRYYFSRDPRLRIHVWGRLSFDAIVSLAQNVKCSNLSIRGNQGSIVGIHEEVYMKTVEMMKKNGSRVDHYNVDGTHHLHLNNPERISHLINKFLLS
ncbi:probable serine hydrolase [Schistocerca serialis cubense]|uniref:probable serine hydrolase n=1 Tax=Schistocerca serialis cubense TaxID=2023355 RepID=UPI00214F4CC5|nr:probable serine hydrolase [Schistocerca serialis cubense]